MFHSNFCILFFSFLFQSVGGAHTSDPSDLIRKATNKQKYEWITRPGGKPDLSVYYERINNMTMELHPKPVSIERYLDGFETPAIRFNALVALTDMATGGYTKIDRDGANGPIHSFQLQK